jgi:hypothetical protein
VSKPENEPEQQNKQVIQIVWLGRNEEESGRLAFAIHMKNDRWWKKIWKNVVAYTTLDYIQSEYTTLQ